MEPSEYCRVAFGKAGAAFGCSFVQGKRMPRLVEITGCERGEMEQAEDEMNEVDWGANYESYLV